MGLRYPLTAAITGGVYTFGRVLYTIGYVSYGNRYKFGAIQPFAGLGKSRRSLTTHYTEFPVPNTVIHLGATWAAIELALGRW